MSIKGSLESMFDYLHKVESERDEAQRKLAQISEITLPSSFNRTFPKVEISDLKAQVQAIITGKKYKAIYNQKIKQILEDSQ